MGELDRVRRYRGGQVIDGTTVQNQSRNGDKSAQLEDDSGQAHKVHLQSHAPNQSSSPLENLKRCKGKERIRWTKINVGD